MAAERAARLAADEAAAAAKEARESAEAECAAMRDDLAAERAARLAADEAIAAANEARERAEAECAVMRDELAAERAARLSADEARGRAENESETLLEKLTSEREARQMERVSLIAERDARQATQVNQKPRYFKGQNDILSNFAPCTLKSLSKTFESSEQLYQYRKAKVCGDEKAATNILKAQGPQIAKRLGDTIKTCSRWEQMKIDVMFETLNIKLNQCERYRDELIATAKRPIIEYTADRFWARGDPKLQDGLNVMGKLHEIARYRLVNNLTSSGPRYKYCKAALVTKGAVSTPASPPANRPSAGPSPVRTWVDGVNMSIPPPPLAPSQNVRHGWMQPYNFPQTHPWFPLPPTYSEMAQRYPPQNVAYPRFY